MTKATNTELQQQDIIYTLEEQVKILTLALKLMKLLAEIHNPKIKEIEL